MSGRSAACLAVEPGAVDEIIEPAAMGARLVRAFARPGAARRGRNISP